MHYAFYQGQDDLSAPFRAAAMTAQSFLPHGDAFLDPLVRPAAAAMTMLSRFQLSRDRPDFGISDVRVGKQSIPVREQVDLDLPFGRLVRFVRDMDEPLPELLVVAPLSGHFATLLRDTVRVLLRDHDVYITDWKNARDAPLGEGRFGVEEHLSYLIRFLERIGPGGHLLSVCQPCVQALAALAVMSEDANPATPRTMTLMAGPIDIRESPTEVNALALERPLSWFENRLIARVPARFAGAGRRVYPGFVQLMAFMSMNLDRHREAHYRMFRLLAEGDRAGAAKIANFYDEYFAVLDLTEEFYIKTIDRVFQRAELATGDFMYRGRKVTPAAIRKTALLTVEGGRDDICGLGQTSAAHDLCGSLRPHLKRHHLQANAGHYGVFSGKRWEHNVYPAVRNMILAME